MECNDGEDAVWREKFQGAFQCIGEFIQFVVDRYSQSLEGSGGRWKTVLAFETDDVLKELVELSRGLPWLLFPPSDDFTGYESGFVLFSIVPYDGLQLFLRGGVEEGGGCHRILLVHAHVERTVHSEGKASFRGVDLMG